MKQAILLCGVGTAVESARQKTFCRLERELAELLEIPCSSAFTSPIIRGKLAEKGIIVPDPEAALNTLAAEGITHLILQPLMLADGGEYQKLTAIAREKAQQFTELRLGTPLLSDESCRRVILNRLSEAFPLKEQQRIILAAHGSDSPAPWTELSRLLSTIGRADILVAALKGESSLNSILPQLTGAKKIILVPLMLTAGHHAVKDIAGDWEPRLLNLGFSVKTVAEGLAEQDWFSRICAGVIHKFP